MNKKYNLAKLMNWCIKRKLNIFLTFSIVSILIFIITQDLICFLLSLLIFAIITLSFRRICSVMIFNNLTHTLSMSLSDINMFKKYDYAKKEDKEKIAKIFKEECINGILNSNIKKLNCHTHKWMINNVFLDERISNIYDIKYKKIKPSTHFFDVILLSSGKDVPNLYTLKEDYVLKIKKKK